MKDYNTEITYQLQQLILDVALDDGYHVDIHEGVCNDTYIIHNHDKALSLVGVKAREYIVLYPQYLNEWGNSFHILMTDNEAKVSTFAQ